MIVVPTCILYFQFLNSLGDIDTEDKKIIKIISVCVPHTCRCGALVNVQGTHGLVCRQAPGKIARYQAVNDTVAHAISAAGIPITKEPVGLTRLDGKRPDGLTLIP